ncbi:1-aminocyclopropane-1-carboxylate oxidase-like [Lingula anatina]|uniref:1-aminocyclopropane-1-carboxylate oxidase-like n=1 Tax=Lingula anatina TaxID=7574 RepID=A0A1S3H3T8_LINAN|nr:1-aminocyclopropane-1-carboxylate oxidase-like [Lingula anatina]|eukprot:XP_013380131.1 1-aminocyclopropane-1-carboxylate oxidase-like [Lingula anatina]
MGSTSKPCLPIIDYSKAKTDRLAVAKELVDALEHGGFAYIDNVDCFEPWELLKRAEWFFSKPDAWKRKVGTKNYNPDPNCKNVYRGFFAANPVGNSYKEGFEFGAELPLDDPVMTRTLLYEHVTWPEEDPDRPNFFREYLQNYQKKMAAVCKDILHMIALGLGLEETAFDCLIEKPLSTMRMLRYPVRTGPHPEAAVGSDGKKLHCDEHTDSDLLTLVAAFNFPGLQIQKDDENIAMTEWLTVDCRPNSLIMNIGECLSRMTGGRLKATRHRVLDLGVQRISMPFFMEPSYDADISKVFVGDKSHGDKWITDPTCTTYGLWSLKRYKAKSNTEYAGTDLY